MTAPLSIWREQLQQYGQQCRAQTPVVPRDTLSHEQEWRCRQIGGSFYGWLKGELPVLLQQRSAVRQLNESDNNPLLVVTTEMTGLVAAHELLHLPSPEIICLLHEEYLRWEGVEGDPDYMGHLHYWNYFREPNAEELRTIRKQGYAHAEEEIRLHVIGCLWSKNMGMETTHLWQWEGEQLHLVKEGFSRSVY